MVTATTLKKVELNFELGKPFDESTPDGRDTTTTVTLDGNKMVTIQKPKNPKQVWTVFSKLFL